MGERYCGLNAVPIPTMQTVVEAAHTVADSVKGVVEGAEEFVEEMTNTTEDDEKEAAKESSSSKAVTLEERKKKLNELRSRLVCPTLSILFPTNN